MSTLMEAGENQRSAGPAERPSAVSHDSWPAILSSGVAVIGVACAAAYTSVKVTDKGVGIAAWVAVAVVGASSMISAARGSRSQDRETHESRSTE